MIKIALVGKKQVGKTFVAFYLKRHHGFKMVRIMEGTTKMMRYFYMYGKWKRPTWERKLDFYDALYNIDPTIHINYLLRRLSTTISNVVVDDVRYVSELHKLKENGFIIIRIAAPEGRRRKIGATIRAARGGTLIVQEYFGADKTASYSADYSVYNENREATRKSIDEILKQLDK